MKRITTLLAAAVLAATAWGTSYAYTKNTEATAAGKTYDTYANVASLGSGLMIEPTFVFEPESLAEIEEVKAKKTARPSSVILTVDEYMNVVLEDGDKTLTSLFDNYLKGTFIPVLRLTDKTVNTFIDYFNQSYRISDIMAISDDVSVLGKLDSDSGAYIVNKVYDLTDTTLSSNRYAEWPHIAEANKVGCNILMYDASDENLPVVAEYVEAMTKVCWAYTDNTTEAVASIAAGCYGVVSTSAAELEEAISYFEKDGFARAQFIAAHRGITAYANEQSLTGIMASANEGATHVEIDIQITSDRQILICHDADIYATARVSGQKFVEWSAETMQKFPIINYSKKYGDTFTSLRDVFKVMRYTDVIIIVELKFDGGSTKAVEQLQAIETFKQVVEEFPEMYGHFFCITFFSPYAEKMKELMPEIPLAYLGAGKAVMETEKGLDAWNGEHKNMLDYAGKIEFLNRRHLGLDEMMDVTISFSAQNYLARGFVQNTWTFSNLSNFTYKANIATTDTAEKCAMLVKEIPTTSLTLTSEQIESGKVKVPCVTYNGWIEEKECDLIMVGENHALLYYEQEYTVDDTMSYGIYSGLITVNQA